jgi:glycosyltransferase involved in cell wall biosynthesis
MATILHLITGLETGGAEGMLLRLLLRADRDRFRPVVISMTDTGTIGPLLIEAGIEVRSLGLTRGRPDPRGVVRLRRILRDLRPALVQTWLYHADLLGLIARQLGYAPHLLWNLRCTETIEASLVRKLSAWFSQIPDIVIANSSAGMRFHQRLGYRPRRWALIPNGFDLRQLRPDEAARRAVRGEIGIDRAAVAVGLPARFHPMKDHRTFLAAAARLAANRPDLVFVLIGPGITGTNPALADAVGALGLSGRVRLLGDRQDMRRIYPALDIVALSSAYGEGFPNVIAEAMCCAVPCVATDVGDAAEIIGSTGAVVPPGDEAALAAAVERLIAAGPERRRALGHQARRRIADNYDLDVIVRRYEILYQEVLGPAPAFSPA